MRCGCKHYKPNCEKLFAPLMLEVARNPQNFPKNKDGSIGALAGITFKYCPWCGRKLKKE